MKSTWEPKTYDRLIIMVDTSSLSNVLWKNFTFLNVIFGLLVYLLFIITKQIIKYRFFSPIKDFPGPFLGSVTRLWLAWHNLRETELAAVQALHKRYGKWSIESPWEIVSDPKQVLSSELHPQCCWYLMQPSYHKSITGKRTNRSIISPALLERQNQCSTCKSTNHMPNFEKSSPVPILSRISRRWSP